MTQQNWPACWVYLAKSILKSSLSAFSDEKYSKWKLQLKCQHHSSFAFSSRSIERTKCIFHSILYPHNTSKWKKIEEKNYTIENCNENNNNCYDYIFSHQLHWKDGNAFPIHTGGLLSWYQSCKRRHSAHWAQHTTAHEQCLSFIFLHHVDSHFSDTISETWIKSCKTRWILGILLKVWLGSFQQNWMHFHSEPFILISVS